MIGVTHLDPLDELQLVERAALLLHPPFYSLNGRTAMVLVKINEQRKSNFPVVDDP